MIDQHIDDFHTILREVYGHLHEDVLHFAQQVSAEMIRQLAVLVAVAKVDPVITSVQEALDGYETITREGERSGVFRDDYDCKKGCGHCCRVKVVCSPLEALVVARHVRETLSSASREHLNRALSRLLEETRGANWETRAELPCPFLEEGACSVYKVRPFVCRGYISLDVRDCLAPRPNLISFDEDRQMLAEVFSHATMLACRAAGLGEAEMVDFHEGLEVFLTDDDAGSAWLEGRLKLPTVM